MKHLVESLSIGTGAILVALVSVGVVYLLCAIFPRPLHSLWVIIVPCCFRVFPLLAACLVSRWFFPFPAAGLGSQEATGTCKVIQN
jgi:hypothetical protein